MFKGWLRRKFYVSGLGCSYSDSIKLNCSHFFLKVEAGHDHRMFLVLKKSEPQCSYCIMPFMRLLIWLIHFCMHWNVWYRKLYFPFEKSAQKIPTQFPSTFEYLTIRDTITNHLTVFDQLDKERNKKRCESIYISIIWSFSSIFVSLNFALKDQSFFSFCLSS